MVHVATNRRLRPQAQTSNLVELRARKYVALQTSQAAPKTNTSMFVPKTPQLSIFKIARHHYRFHPSQHDRCRSSSTSPRMSSYCRLQGHTTSRQWKAHDYWYVYYGIVGCWFKSKYRADAPSGHVECHSPSNCCPSLSLFWGGNV